jgi:hypothetical protein
VLTGRSHRPDGVTDATQQPEHGATTTQLRAPSMQTCGLHVTVAHQYHYREYVYIPGCLCSRRHRPLTPCFILAKVAIVTCSNCDRQARLIRQGHRVHTKGAPFCTVSADLDGDETLCCSAVVVSQFVEATVREELPLERRVTSRSSLRYNLQRSAASDQHSELAERTMGSSDSVLDRPWPIVRKPQRSGVVTTQVLLATMCSHRRLAV